MGIPQIIMIILFGMDLGMSLVKHGESKGKFDFGTSLIAVTINVVLLKWGGFF